MVPPLAVAVTAATKRRWLLALRQAPVARQLYRYLHLRILVVAFLASTYFHDLREAVRAATSKTYLPAIRVMRDVTLPAPVDYFYTPANFVVVWVCIPKGERVSILGGGYRLRMAVPIDGSPWPEGCALFSIGGNARLTIKDLRLEVFQHGPPVSEAGPIRLAWLAQRGAKVCLATSVQTIGFAEVLVEKGPHARSSLARTLEVWGTPNYPRKIG